MNARKLPLLLVPLLLLPLIGADEKPVGPVRLFNAKDLSGWTWVGAKPGATIDDVWSVKDGNLHCNGRPAGYIRTEKDYTNYVLRLQVRHLTPGNGGVL